MKITLNFLYIAIFLLQESMQDDTGPTMFDKKDFKATDEADALDKLFADEKDLMTFNKIIDILTGVSNKQRLEIVDAYQKQTKKDLPTELDKYFTGDVEKDNDATRSNLRDLLRSPGEYLAVRIDSTLTKKGKDETYMTVLCTSTGDELKSITAAYPGIGGKKSLREKLDKTLDDSDLKAFFLYLIDDSKAPLRSNAKADDKKTEDLLKSVPSGDKGPCTAEKNKPFFDMMAKESFDQIKAVAEKFKGDIVDTVANKCEGKLASAFTRILRFAMKPGNYFSDEALIWIGGISPAVTEDNNIASAAVRIVISRCEVDLAGIKAAYFSSYKRQLKDDLKNKLDESENRYNVYLMNKLIDGNKS